MTTTATAARTISAYLGCERSTGRSKVGLGSWVELHEESCRGGRIHRLLVNHRSHVALAVDEKEADLYRHLAEGGTIDDDPMPSELTVWLGEIGFLGDSDQTVIRTTDHNGVHLSLKSLDLRWDGANEFVRAFHRMGGRLLFHPAAVIAQVFLAIAGSLALMSVLDSHRSLHLQVNPDQLPFIFALTILAVAVHETAHALVVVHHGRRVDAIGFKLLLGAPACYVEAVDALLLTRKQRMIQAAAGPWAEWLVVSVVALLAWRSPDIMVAPMLRRFVIINSACIASNLLPFAGLDGSWLFADALAEPDLNHRSRGSVRRLASNLINGTSRQRIDWALAAYSTLNSAVAGLLLITSVFFWYQLFGRLSRSILDSPGGWIIFSLAAVLLVRPLVAPVLRKTVTACNVTGQLAAEVRFRLQWRWRIAATRHLARTDPRLAGFDDSQLSVIAGNLTRTRILRAASLAELRGQHILVWSGSATTTWHPGSPSVINPGTTLPPERHPQTCSRGAVLITLDPAHLRTDSWPV